MISMSQNWIKEKNMILQEKNRVSTFKRDISFYLPSPMTTEPFYPKCQFCKQKWGSAPVEVGNIPSSYIKLLGPLQVHWWTAILSTESQWNQIDIWALLQLIRGPRPNPSGRRRTQFVAWTFRAWHGDLPIHQVQLHQHAHAYPQNMYYTCHMIRLCVKIGYLQNEHGLIIVFPMINTCCAGSCGLAHDTRNINFKTTDYRHWDMKSNLKTPKKIMRFH